MRRLLSILFLLLALSISGIEGSQGQTPLSSVRQVVGLSNAEAAKSLLYRARNQLRETLADYMAEMS